MKSGFVASLENIQNKNVSRIMVEVYYIMTYFMEEEKMVNPEGNWRI